MRERKRTEIKIEDNRDAAFSSIDAHFHDGRRVQSGGLDEHLLLRVFEPGHPGGVLGDPDVVVPGQAMRRAVHHYDGELAVLLVDHVRLEVADVVVG